MRTSKLAMKIAFALTRDDRLLLDAVEGQALFVDDLVAEIVDDVLLARPNHELGTGLLLCIHCAKPVTQWRAQDVCPQ
jgi:hypothetical protein